jgi:hypothetical protein
MWVLVVAGQPSVERAEMERSVVDAPHAVRAAIGPTQR